MLISSVQRSPVILLLKVTDRDETGTTPHCKLVLYGGPLDASGCAVNPEDDQGGLPRVALQGPHIGIAVSATGDNSVALWGPVDACVGKRRQSYIFMLCKQLDTIDCRVDTAKL